MKPISSIPLALCLMLAGCAAYHYEITPAGEPVKAVLRDQDLIIPAKPAELRLRQLESRCVLMIENPGKEMISLEGSGCAIVDPAGQSRAIAARLLPPGSHLKLVLPPIKEVQPRGPEFRFGIGMQVDSSDLSQPRKAIYLSPGSESQEYWEWDGPGVIKLFLTIKQNEQSTKHEFEIRRTKE